MYDMTRPGVFALDFLLVLKMDQQPNNPLHGKNLESILTELVDKYGWEAMGERIRIKCFTDNPSISSSLKFLRKTPWAREKVEQFYLRAIKD